MRRSDEGPGCTPGAATEEDRVATATTTRQQALTVARQKARERRLTLDRSRDEADRKVEEATATTLVALDARDAVVAALEAAEQNVSSALRDLLACPGVTLDRAAVPPVAATTEGAGASVGMQAPRAAAA